MSKTTITKAIEEFEWAGEQFERNKDAARTKKVRLAATLMDTLESVDIRVKKMTDAKDTCIDTIFGMMMMN